MNGIEAVRWSPDGGAVRIIDQRRLPAAYVERDLATVDDVRDAIASLAVRGAPAIGICGAMGVVIAAAAYTALEAPAFLDAVRGVAASIVRTRPTAVNLAWAVERVIRRATAAPGDSRAKLAAMRDEATAILAEDRAMCRRIGEAGVALLGHGARVLTYCNAGALATGGIGTALAPVYVAAERGVPVSVLAAETRPALQGARLTTWELARAGIPVTLVTDGSAAARMRAGEVDLCLVGADRIAANGDVANKIGTYGLAVAARHHGIPFYVAAPSSTVDPATPDGGCIEIERRHPDEVAAPMPGVTIDNPAFDVTPASLIAAIVTDHGVIRPPFSF